MRHTTDISKEWKAINTPWQNNKKKSLSEMYNDYQKSRRKHKTKEMFSADSSVSCLIVLLGCVTLISSWFGSSCGSTASRQIREIWTGQCCKQALALALAEQGAQYQLSNLSNLGVPLRLNVTYWMWLALFICLSTDRGNVMPSDFSCCYSVI